MNIIGPDAVVFGVQDVAACAEYFTDFGLAPIEVSDQGGRFEALDGTAVLLRRADDPSLPAPLASGNTLRQTVYGVADAATINEIAEELGRDRSVVRTADGAIDTVDDLGFALRFQVTQRRPLELAGELVNAPGAPVQRPANVLGVHQDMAALPRTLSHVVLFVPDIPKAEAFYVERLGFRLTDRFTHLGPFLRPAGSDEHHTLFFLATPPHIQGCEHIAFHLGGPTELMLAGSRFIEKGYQSFWGPGRHKLGSNWFWYFNSPVGCHVEYDADMDKHDDDWTPRDMMPGAQNSQTFLLQNREKWAPGG